MASAADLTNYFGPISLVVGGVWTWVKWRASKAEQSGATKVQADANLQDDQREFITVLQSENRTWRAEVAKLHQALDELRADMEKLRDQLGIERRARENAEARYLELLERKPGEAAP